MSDEPAPEIRYLVLGGAGFLGSYIVQALISRGDTHVAVFDLREPAQEDKIERVSYYTGDICNLDRLVDVLKETGANVVFHAVSPIHGLSDSIYQRVNVDGTKTLLEACRHPSLSGNVFKFVYTSSTGVTWRAQDIVGATEEQLPIPENGYDMYHHTKAVAEKMVLEADGDGMRTVVIRPGGMIGPRDPQLLHRLAAALAEKKHKVQIGNNTNLVDWVYAGNVADAHLAAADRLPSRKDLDANTTPHPVAGQVFIITNGTPMLQWDFSRLVWRALGASPADLDPKKATKIPRWLALFMATIAESWCKLNGGHTELTKFNVIYSTTTQWYNIDKARHALGYQPRVSLEEAAAMSAKWWKERGEKEHKARQASRRKLL
ncbi:putative sterol dehydrogenase [Obba rivulosa]|uniref:Putative sterol dehydrogenase n=1 Tax=Obba rivulosa TaxID=1052685 RepID=A0A8E2DSH6_9APHY|nr:putative sterol dehydrogenase [Obba rivulosa]